MLTPSHPRGYSRSIHGGHRGRGHRSYCTYCNRLSHIQDRWYQLHGRPPRTAHVAQSSEPPPPLIEDQSLPPSQGVTLTPVEYEEFLRLTHAAKSTSIASVAQTGNASTYLTHSLGPWILDSGAYDHLPGNKDLLSSLTIISPLLMITLANGTQTIAKGIGSERKEGKSPRCKPQMEKPEGWEGLWRRDEQTGRRGWLKIGPSVVTRCLRTDAERKTQACGRMGVRACGCVGYLTSEIFPLMGRSS